MATITVASTPLFESLDGEERDDFLKSVEYYGHNNLEWKLGEVNVELIRVFPDMESFFEHALDDVYELDFNHYAFANGAVMVHEQTLITDYEFAHTVYVVEDMYSHPFYVLKEVLGDA